VTTNTTWPREWFPPSSAMIQFSLDGCPSYVMVVVESNYPYLLGAEQLRSSSTLERQPRSSSVWKCSLDSSTLFVRPCVRGALVYPQTISFSHSLRIELCRVFRVVPVSKCRLSEVCLPPSLKKSLPSPQLYDLPTLDLALPLPNPLIPVNSIPERHPLPPQTRPISFGCAKQKQAKTTAPRGNHSRSGSRVGRAQAANG